MKQVLLTLTALMMILSSCKSTKKTLGLTENMPDEFQVTKVAPLEMPPHFIVSKTDQDKKAKIIKE
jgi:hypothetical protein